MEDQVKINKKCIKDPLYAPIIKFLNARLSTLKKEGPEDEYILAQERYEGLVSGDLVIENPIVFDDGRIQACFVARKTGFARVDVIIDPVPIKDVFDAFSFEPERVESLEEFVNKVNLGEGSNKTFYLEWLGTYAVVLTEETVKTEYGAMEAMEDIFFQQYETDDNGSIDLDTYQSGTITITDPSVSQTEIPLFIEERVKTQLDLTTLRTNLPESVLTERGDHFSIPLTVWFGSDEVTKEVAIRLSTNNGYAIPLLGENQQSIGGEIIYGSAASSIDETLVVRISYVYKERTYTGTFKTTLKIQQDPQFDLVFEVTPEEIVASKDDIVQVTVKTRYKDELISPMYPAETLSSNNNWGELTLVEQKTSGEIIYSGKITGIVDPSLEFERALYTGSFRHQVDGRVIIAPVYFNMKLIKPETKPILSMVSFDNEIKGEYLEEGIINVEIDYNEEPLSPTNLELRLGVKGTKELVRLDSLTEEGIKYTIVKDPVDNGVFLDDNFEVVMSYTNESGVRQTITEQVSVTAYKPSEVSISPITDDPISINRYGTGAFPFKVIINGEDKSTDIKSLTVKDSKNYIRIYQSTGYQCLSTATIVSQTTVTFTWKQTYDNEVHTLTGTKVFSVNPYKGGKIAVVPNTIQTLGYVGDYWQTEVKVYNQDADITKNAVYNRAKSVVPSNMKLVNTYYNSVSGNIILQYSKTSVGVSTGSAVFTSGVVTLPTADQMGTVSITARVSEARVIKVISQGENIEGRYMKDSFIPLSISFANKEISLLDPNLTITLANNDDNTETITKVDEDGVTVKYTLLSINGESSGGTSLNLSYNDDGTVINKVVLISRVFLPAEIAVSSIPPITAKIWDTGILPITMTADDEDITDRVNNITALSSGTEYVTIDRSYIWEVVNANKEESVIPVPIKLSFYDDELVLGTAGSDLTFHLAGWDGVRYKGTFNPSSIQSESGQSGEIVGIFTYKGTDGSYGTTLNLDKSVIPDTITLGTPGYLEEKGYVIPYQTKNGGDNPLVLSFLSQNSTDEYTAEIPVSVAWNQGINILSSPELITGKYTQVVSCPIEFNVDGRKLKLTDRLIKVNVSSGSNNPVVLFELKDDSISLSLNKGGDLGKSYSYTTAITILYDDGNGVTYTKTLSIPTDIYVNNVSVKSNSVVSGNVYDKGTLEVDLVDEDGVYIDPVKFVSNEINTFIEISDNNKWKIIDGNKTGPVSGKQFTRVYFNYGGGEKYLDYNLNYTIGTFDGYVFKATPSTKAINGDSGTIGELTFTFTYKGDPITSVLFDVSSSTIPGNISLSTFSDGKLPFSLKSHGTETMKVGFKRENATGTVKDDDWTQSTIEVSTRSTDETLYLQSDSGTISLNWKDKKEFPLTLKYGDTVLSPNSPGVTLSLKTTGDKAVSIGGVSSTGVSLTADRSGGPDSQTLFNDTLIASFDLGDDIVKTAELPVEITITTGSVSVINNTVISGKVWAKGILPQGVTVQDKVIQEINSISVNDSSSWIKMVSAKGYEIIGWEEETSSHVIPMVISYLLDNKEYTVNFNLDLTVEGYTGVKFKVESNREDLNMGLNQTGVVVLTPIYKDIAVGNKASFKESLSTIPSGISLIQQTNNGSNHTLTFQATKSGTYDLDLVFWSPEYNTDSPNQDETAHVNLESTVLGELGIEIGTRDNRIIGRNGDTGTYLLEVLFGGERVPLTDSNLSISVDKGESTSMNANVLTITQLGEERFDYSVSGVVSPESTIDVSDFITLSYIYNDKTYTRSVEIPLTYTSPVINSDSLNTLTSAIWKSTGVSPILTCADINISNNSQLKSATFSDGTTKDGYLEIVKNATSVGRWDISVYNADKDKKVYTAKFKLMGVYRNWSWSKELETIVTLDAWDGNYITAKLLDTSAVMSGTTGSMASSAFQVSYKNSIPVGSNSITVDESRSIFNGTLKMTETRNTTSKVTLLSTVLNGGTGTLKYCLMMPNPPANPVEGVDFIMVSREYNFKEKAVTVSGTATVTGGQDAIVTIPMKLAYGSDNLPINSSGLTITLDNDNYISLTGNRTATTLEGKITAPWDTVANGTYTVKVNISYTDTSNKTAVTSYTQSVTITRPSDWPVVKNVNSAAIEVKAWDAGPCPFTVTSSGVDITAQAKPISFPTSGFTTLDPDYEKNGNWWFVSQARGAAVGLTQKPTITFQVPYRGKTATLTGQQGFKLLASSSEIIPFKVTTINGIGESTVGTEGEFAFTVLYQNRPYTDVKAVVKTSGIYTLRGPNNTVGDAAGTTTVTPIRVEGNTIYIGYKSITDNSSTGVTLGLMLGTSTTTAINNKVDGDTVSLSFLPGVVGTNITSPVLSNTDPQPLPFSLVTTTGAAVNNYTLLTVSDDLSYLMVRDGNTFSANGIPTDGDKVTNVTFGITLPSGYSKTYIEVTTTVTLKAEV